MLMRVAVSADTDFTFDMYASGVSEAMEDAGVPCLCSCSAEAGGLW